MEPHGENEPLAKRDYILFKHPSKAENSGNLLCYKPLAVLAIQRDNTEALIGTHQSQSRCNSSGVSSSQFLFKLLNNGDNIVRGLPRGALPSQGHIHKANSLPSQRRGTDLRGDFGAAGRSVGDWEGCDPPGEFSDICWPRFCDVTPASFLGKGCELARYVIIK